MVMIMFGDNTGFKTVVVWDIGIFQIPISQKYLVFG